MKKISIILSFFCTLICFGCGINQCFGLKDDNPIEEVIEKVIESQTGIEIDLTPFSPE